MTGQADQGRIRQMTRDALDAFDRTPLSATTRTCQRIAHLRGDWQALTWLEAESFEFSGGPRSAHDGLSPALMREIAGSDASNAARAKVFERWMDRRRISEDKVAAHSLDQLEALMHMYEQELLAMQPLQGDSQYSQSDKAEARRKLNESLEFVRTTYAKSREAIWQYLLQTERELDFTEVNQAIFERTKRLVDRRLTDLAPDALDRFNGAFRALRQDDAESRSHAATSCRRVLSSVADLVCPARKDPATDAAGKQRSLTADKHVNRLLWFIQEATTSATAANMTRGTLSDLASRIDAMERLSGKGVHSVPDVEEVEMLAIQTYLLVGDLLRLYEVRGAV